MSTKKRPDSFDRQCYEVNSSKKVKCTNLDFHKQFVKACQAIPRNFQKSEFVQQNRTDALDFPLNTQKNQFQLIASLPEGIFLQGHVANIHRNFKNLLQLTYCSQRPAAFRRSSLSSGSLKTNLLRCMGRKFVSAEAKLRPANKMKESSRSCVVESASREVVSFECYTVGE